MLDTYGLAFVLLLLSTLPSVLAVIVSTPFLCSGAALVKLGLHLHSLYRRVPTKANAEDMLCQE